jgi:hypothetical protein
MCFVLWKMYRVPQLMLLHCSAPLQEGDMGRSLYARSVDVIGPAVGKYTVAGLPWLKHVRYDKIRIVP